MTATNGAIDDASTAAKQRSDQGGTRSIRRRGVDANNAAQNALGKAASNEAMHIAMQAAIYAAPSAETNTALYCARAMPINRYKAPP